MRLIFALLLIGCNAGSSDKLVDLAPKLRLNVEDLISRMEGEGYNTRISETFRSPTRQKALAGLSKLLPGFAVTSTTVSRHSRVRGGKPAACAVDLRPIGLETTAEQAQYYAELRDQAREIGLSSGADYKPRKSSPFYDYGLGWDPGHIYAKICG